MGAETAVDMGDDAGGESVPRGLLAEGTTLHSADPGTGITHVVSPSGEVKPVATSLLTPADHRMLGATRAAAPVEDSRPYAAEVNAAASKYPAATPDVLHGILEQESQHGLSSSLSQVGSGGTGDGGHGHGLMQIDDRYHQDFLAKSDPTSKEPLWSQPGANIEEGARIYQDAYDQAKAAGVPGDKLQEVALNGYNHGPGVAIEAYKKGVDLPYAHLAGAKIASGSASTTRNAPEMDPKLASYFTQARVAGDTDTPAPSGAPTTEVARPPVPTDSEIAAAKSKDAPESVLGRFVRTVQMPNGPRIVSVLGSDGAVHDYDFEKLKEKSPELAKHLVDSFGLKDSYRSSVGDPSIVQQYVTDPLRAAANGAGVSGLLGMDPASADLASKEHPIANTAGMLTRTALATSANSPLMPVAGAIPNTSAPGNAMAEAAKAAEVGVKPSALVPPAAAPAASGPTTGTTPVPSGPTLDETQLARDQADLSNAGDAQKQAAATEATARADQATKLGAASAQAVDDIKAASDKEQAAYGEAGKAMQARFDAMKKMGSDLYQQAVVNPNRLWQSMSTGQKVAGGIGLIFSNIGATFMGTTPVNLIGQAIDRDIQAQQETFRNRARAGAVTDNAFAQLVQKGLSQVDATHTLRTVGLEVAKQQIAGTLQTTNSQIAKAAGEKAIADLEAQQVAGHIGIRQAATREAMEKEQIRRMQLANEAAQNPGLPPTNPQNHFTVKGHDFALPGAKEDADAKAIPAEANAYESSVQALDAMKSAEKEVGSSMKWTGPGKDVQANKAFVLERITAAMGGKETPAARALVAQYNELFDPRTLQSSAQYDRGVDALKARMKDAIDARFRSKGLPAYSEIASPAEKVANAGGYTPGK